MVQDHKWHTIKKSLGNIIPVDNNSSLPEVCMKLLVLSYHKTSL